MSNHLAFLITCLTDLHAGSGDANYGYIDKTVQRDAITNFPTIYATSLKGALREHLKLEKNSLSPEDIVKIFGSEHASNEEQMAQGNYRFFGADLLSMPIRSNRINSEPFYRATSARACNDLKTKLATLVKVNNMQDWNWPTENINNGNISTEYGQGRMLQNPKYLGDSSIQLCEEDFNLACKNLPVRARNQLENGESKNLWYEEFVPRETRFIFCIRCDNDSSLKKRFENTLDENVIQFGANASVGMGFCLIQKLN